MSKRGRLGVGILATALICAPGGAALARAGGYTIGEVAVQPKSIESQPTGQKHPRFRITLHGTATHEVVLDVYLDWRTCPTSAGKEYKRDSMYTPGYSYFLGPRSLAPAPVKGSFTQTFYGHPGSKTGPRYVCAYLISPKSPNKTLAFNSASYAVTK